MKKIILILMLLITSMLLADTYTVEQDGTGNFVSIYEAINDQNVIDGDIILVYPGIYYENIAYYGKNITVASLYYTTYNSSYISNTIIDGTELESVVSFKHGESNEAVLCGFTIQNGLGGDYPDYTGGGISITYGSPTLQNLIITNNSSGYGGGGILCSSSNASFSDITITENTTQQYGAGIYVVNLSHITVNNVNIINNQTLEIYPFTEGIYVHGDSIGSYIQYDPESERNVAVGGGVCLRYSEAVFDNVIIDSNISQEGAGLWGEDSNVTFDECEITNNSSEGSPWPWAGGVVCLLGSNFNFTNSIINSNSAGSNSVIGGILVKDISATLTMENSEICDNTAEIEGGGLVILGLAHAVLSNVLISGNTLTGVGSSGGGIFYVGDDNESSLTLNNVKIINNTATKGGGLFLCYSGINLSNVEISQNNAQKGSGLYCIVSDPIIKNTTFAFNTSTNSGGAIYCTQNSYPELVNTILWDNLPQEIFFDENDLSNSIDIDYSDIEGGEAGIITNNNGTVNWGTGNINEDPLFLDPENYDFSLKWTETQKSPCINTGDPNSPEDPDGSRADMGAYYKDHEIKTYEFEGTNGAHDGWTWLSFDILDIYNMGQTNKIEELWEPIKWSTEIGKHEDLNFIFLDPDWQNGEYQVFSQEGFKVKMESGSDQIEVSGFRCIPATTFDIDAIAPVGNWIGYFIEKPQHVYDAFDGYLHNIYMIKHQDWSIKSGSGVGGWPDVPYTLVPGDMVIVWCYEDIEHFSWIDQEESEKYTVPKVQDFIYTEEADYIPIYIDLDPTDMPDEIGVMLDGECKGATVVTDTLADICAYVTESQGGNLEFEFSYGNRGTNEIVKEYTVFEPTTGFRETTKIDLKDKQDCYYVSFRSPSDNNSGNLLTKLSASNYPNPFNPTTTISYNLPSDGEIKLSIYNIRGQQVKTLIKGEQIAGSYEVIWNGKDNNEKSVSSGLYFYKLSTRDETIMKKILMLK